MTKSVVTLIATVGIMLTACDTSGLRKEIATLEIEKEMLKDSLVAARQEIEYYRTPAEEMRQRAEEMFAIGNIDSLRSIYSIMEKYHPNVDDTKDVSRLVAKTKTEKEKYEQERNAIVDKLRKKYDDVQGITWYYNPYFRHYDNTNRASLYIGQKEDAVWLRFKLSYEGDDWIFFDRAFISYDGNTYEVTFDKYKEKESDNDTRVWEWIDVPAKGDLLTFIRSWVNGKSVKMQLVGKYGQTRTLTSSEIRGLKDVLTAYDVLKSKLK